MIGCLKFPFNIVITEQNYWLCANICQWEKIFFILLHQNSFCSFSFIVIQLKLRFHRTQELVALSGAHTLGSKGFGSPTSFDNSYYKVLLEKPPTPSGKVTTYFIKKFALSDIFKFISCSCHFFDINDVFVLVCWFSFIQAVCQLWLVFLQITHLSRMMNA